MSAPNMGPKARAALSKDNTRPPAASPPPAYTPRRQPDLATLTARAIQARHGLSTVAQMLQRPPQSAYTTLLDSAEDEQDPESSPISLRINTSVNVSRSNNVVCLASSPADQANAIAQAVVKALHQGSSGQCGIPMIDENGAPRPLRIEVDAGLVVDGTNNIVGSRENVTEVLRQRDSSVLGRRQRQEDGRDQDQDQDMENDASQSSKRRRSSQ
ncbi:hypothetical protein B0J13DRAFT_25072 [Dactylonectria estremocensis]|uniref:Uncharacterized protein n=1 Tax=Dactylonectria estremocensis TaxID=1079267 RepID=A0A9P9JEU0_9HYPO|nr:hypothetical protein B0J13DRAFT_25072 [Dactylonectria estremocensis]